MKINNMESKIYEMINLAKEKLKNGDNVGAENLIKERLKITEKNKKDGRCNGNDGRAKNDVRK